MAARCSNCSGKSSRNEPGRNPGGACVVPRTVRTSGHKDRAGNLEAFGANLCRDLKKKVQLPRHQCFHDQREPVTVRTCSQKPASFGEAPVLLFALYGYNFFCRRISFLHCQPHFPSSQKSIPQDFIWVRFSYDSRLSFR